MAKKINKVSYDEISTRQRYQRLSPGTKAKIVHEIQNGSIGQRQAARKYNVNRRMIRRWMGTAAVAQLIAGNRTSYESFQNPVNSEMKNPDLDKKLVHQIKALTKELSQAKLKIASLETLIVVAEEDLKIKIRKKHGSKQSRDCDKAAQK